MYNSSHVVEIFKKFNRKCWYRRTTLSIYEFIKFKKKMSLKAKVMGCRKRTFLVSS